MPAPTEPPRTAADAGSRPLLPKDRPPVGRFLLLFAGLLALALGLAALPPAARGG